jgi:hypothetical protein
VAGAPADGEAKRADGEEEGWREEGWREEGVDGWREEAGERTDGDGERTRDGDGEPRPSRCDVAGRPRCEAGVIGVRCVLGRPEILPDAGVSFG